MDVGIIGFGKTGKAVASVLLRSRQTRVQWVVRRSRRLEHASAAEVLDVRAKESAPIYSTKAYSAEELFQKHPVDAIIDFSSEDGIEYYADAAADFGVTVVSAVSGYPDSGLRRLKKAAEKTVVMHSPNITVGINFLMLAAKVLKNIAPETDIEVIEEHFREKQEVSGTAKKIADTLDVPEDTIKSVRAGGIVGIHEILFGFPSQVVRLKHESISREAFGNGILFAVRNLQGKPAGFYTMEKLLAPYFTLSEEGEGHAEA